MTTLDYYNAALQAQSLENSLLKAVNISRLQGIRSDITKAQADNSFNRAKELAENFAYGTIKNDQ